MKPAATARLARIVQRLRLRIRSDSPTAAIHGRLRIDATPERLSPWRHVAISQDCSHA